MRKLFTCALLLFFFQSAVFAQDKPSIQATQTTVDKEIKAALVSKLSITETIADRVVVIEKQFHTNLNAITALGDIPLKDKDVKLNEVHRSRRTQLMSSPLTGRQMEDVISVTDALYRKYKL